MSRFKYVGEVEVLVPELGLTVSPGDVVEADAINNEMFVPVKEKPAAKEADK